MAANRRVFSDSPKHFVQQKPPSNRLFDVNSPLAGSSSTSANIRVIVHVEQVPVVQEIQLYVPLNSAMAGPSMVTDNYDSYDR